MEEGWKVENRIKSTKHPYRQKINLPRIKIAMYDLFSNSARILLKSERGVS